MNIGEKIKQKRIELGMTQEQLSDLCGYKDKSSITKIEKSISLPFAKIEKLSKALQCDPAYLMGWEDEVGIKKTLSDGTAIHDVRLLTLYSQLNDKNRKIVMDLIATLLESQVGNN